MVVTWGRAEYGGDSSVSRQLTYVIKIYSNSHAFAAVTVNNGVVTWGDPDYGGFISSSMKNQLDNITGIYSTAYAFAAITDPT